MSNLDLTEVIEDAMQDAVTPETPTESVEASVDVATDVGSETQIEDAPAEGTTEVASPAAADQAAQDDPFEKEWGISSKSITGRENRVPHGRVKEMVTKADKKGYDRAVKEITSKFNPQVKEFEGKVKDYEDRLTRVAEFENVLTNDPRTFLNMLSQVPAYKEFFDYLGQLAQSGQPQVQPQPGLNLTEMPQPDQPLADGTKVYSMEGLQKLLDWQAKQVEQRAVQRAEESAAKRYAPIEQEWQAQQQYAKMVPVIQQQITEARTWDRFNELEPVIIEALKADRSLSLEKAYVKAYQGDVASERERLSADRNKIRTEVLEEIRKKPVASSVPTSSVRPGTQPSGSRSLEDIISEEVRKAGLSR